MDYVKANLLLIYSIVSLFLFKQVYQASKQVIDEEFHLRQGRHYCFGNFSVWDNKITTFPGLYLASTVFLFPLKLCSTFALRMTSLLASVVNVFLIYNIRAEILGNNQKLGKNSHSQILHCIETLSISLLPPMYFFAHLYYTDVLAITTVLGMMLTALREQHLAAAICGAASVVIRQTNIVWVGMFFGIAVLNAVVRNTNEFLKHDKKRKKLCVKINYDFKDFITVVRVNVSSFKLLTNQIKLITTQFSGYIVVLVSFLIFLKWNGSIVVGDKSAHEASIHLPQILYFSLFNTIFGFATTLLPNIKSIFKFTFKRWLVIILLITLLGIIVRFNTLVHPYLLADNRHYTFYLWNRFYGKFELARYAIIPIYCFSLLNIRENLKSKSFGFQLLFILCGVVQMALQKMIEVRYFLLPYLILRLNCKAIGLRWILTELLFYVVVNAATFYVFFTKEIWWDDYKDVQRLMW